MCIHRLALSLVTLVSAGLLACVLFAEEPEEGRRYALVVGVQNYEGTGLGSLHYCDNDAAGLADVLRKRGYHVTLMTRPEYKARDLDDLLPTADNIRGNLKAILLNRKRADTVLLAFAGHGEQLKKDGRMYFCPAKCDLDKPDTLIGLDEVYALLKDNEAGGKVLIVDACRNDPLAGRAVGSEKLESVTRPELPDPPASTVALFSCGKGQVAYESDALKHGFLFHFVIEGLEGKAANKKDGRITWLGLAKHVDDELPDAVREEMGSKAVQTPEVRGESLALVLARVDTGSAPQDTTTTEGKAVSTLVGTLSSFASLYSNFGPIDSITITDNAGKDHKLTVDKEATVTTDDGKIRRVKELSKYDFPRKGVSVTVTMKKDDATVATDIKVKSK